MPQSSLGGYPSLEAIMSLARVFQNDWQAGATLMPGEGQITTDNPLLSPQTLPAINSSLRELFRELRNVGDPTLIRDNVLVNLPQNAATGPGVQTYLGFQGYFDGLNFNVSPTLPQDLMFPLELWEQQTGTGLPFIRMHQPVGGLSSVTEQTTLLRVWEWRGGAQFAPGLSTSGGDALFFVGSVLPITIRIRYQAALPTYKSYQLNIAGWVASGNDITFTCANSLTVGEQITLSGFEYSTFFNGLTVTVTAVNPANFHATVVGTSGATDTGFALPIQNYPLDFASTYVPVMDCEEAVAYKVAYKIASALSGITPGVQALQQNAMEAMRQLKNENVRRAQTQNFERKPYGGGSNQGSGYYGSEDNLL